MKNVQIPAGVHDVVKVQKDTSEVFVLSGLYYDHGIVGKITPL